MKRRDLIFSAVILAAAFLWILVRSMIPESENRKVVITVHGEVFGTYSLNNEQEIDINGSNTLLISNGNADVTWADCPDKVCVHQKSIRKNGESIICLPNEVVVSIESDETASYDVIVN